ncbi:hypothetical protein EIN_205930 [Entamoeba invadens IP1]|uniref:Uncharacterized protein n=1 Tax=Entamoeba invadens IP1 TaxID=370355 RepID=A0A0A1U9G6_ENTIV|nr:hypothetical protein EIN_205930 [Entamoeba invadens IP1]ELP91626.1 hypothetical protein EIN_205930 [Entamoeba invadens IP1]|eukprot:XP_004258397.1 hypothetical protein EIN_205930 [Entamoeba invadens IP1]
MENFACLKQVFCNCALCRQFTLVQQVPKIKTTKLCVLILLSLQDLYNDKEYFSLKTDIFVFIKSHWDVLNKFKQFKQPNWKKAILDAFNHCTSIQSGKGVYKTRGFYKLKPEERMFGFEEFSEKTQMKKDLIEAFTHLQEAIQKNALLFSEVQKKCRIVSADDYNYVLNTHNASFLELGNFVQMMKVNKAL